MRIKKFLYLFALKSNKMQKLNVTKQTLLMLCLSFAIHQANAQSWNLAGNADATAASYLGTSNAVDLQFKTNNITRGTFNSLGLFTLNGNLTWSSRANGITFTNAGTGTINPMIRMFASGFINGDRMVLAHSASYPNWGLQYQDIGDKFRFLRDSVNVMAIDLANKRVGISTSTPLYPLHVSGDHVTSYVTSDFLDPDEAAMRVNVNSIFNYGVRGLYCKSSSGNGTSTAGYFESDFIAVDGHSNGAGGTAYGTSGVATGGTAAYGAYGKASGGSLNYGVYGTVSGSGTKYGVYCNGNFGGTGTNLYTSDKKLKKNIKPLNNVLDKLMQLKPAYYDFRVGEFGAMNLAEGKHFGFIAQEVKNVFPELVSNQSFPPQYNDKQEKIAEAIDYLGMNYTELIPVIIEGMQEQQQTIQQQNELIEKLSKRLDALEGNQSLTQPIAASNTKISGAELFQNIPNPAKRITKIQYTIPASVTNAYLICRNAQGAVVAQYDIQQKGKGQMNIDTNAFVKGQYFVSLICDNAIVKSIQMELL